MSDPTAKDLKLKEFYISRQETLREKMNTIEGGNQVRNNYYDSQIKLTYPFISPTLRYYM